MNIQNTTLALSLILISACTPSKPSSEFSVEEFSNVSGDINIVVSETHLVGHFDTEVRTNLGTDTHNILLDENDQLVARIDGEEKDMRLLDTSVKFDWESDSTYGNRFDGDRSGSAVTVALRRDGVEHNKSTIELPMPIAISAPATNETFNSDDSISIAWMADDAIDELRVGFSGRCDIPDSTEFSNRIYVSHTVTVPDTGSITIPIAEVITSTLNFEANSMSTIPDGAVCSTKINLKREKIERSDFGSGSITATQYDYVNVIVVF